MIPTVWNEKYLLGIDAIDKQHRQLFDLIGEMNRLIDVHAGAGEIQAVLGRFLRWAEVHFASEETLLAVIAYPGFAAHRAEHVNFLETMERNVRLVSSRPLMVTEMNISGLLINWLQDHILVNDKKYVPHVLASLRTQV